MSLEDALDIKNIVTTKVEDSDLDQELPDDETDRKSNLPKHEEDGEDEEETEELDNDAENGGEMDDLFGDDRDNDEAKDDGAATPASSEHADGISPSERRHREAMEYAEEEEPDQVVEEVLEASAQVPNIPVPRSSDGSVRVNYESWTHWVLNTPNYFRVDSKPFHPDTYLGPDQEEEFTRSGKSAREASLSIKLQVENTIRWRWTKDEHGQDRRQSNSRIIRWSDGSLSLQLGKELLDVVQQPDTSSASRQAIGGGSQATMQASQSTQSNLKDNAPTKGHGLTYLVAQHKRAEILQCEALITGTMTLLPTGMQSETHRALAKAISQKHDKVARLRMAPDPTTDPEREKMELMKQAAKKPRKARGEEDGFGGNRRKRASYSRKRHGDDMWSDDDDDEAFGGGSEEEYGQASSGKKRPGEDISNKRGPGEYQNDDFLVADSDEGEAEGDSDSGARKKGRRRKEREEDHEEDDLDKLEAKIEAEERRRKLQATDEPKDAGDVTGGKDEAMDIESEEDEDDWGVRRAGTGSRKRRAIDFDDEDEE